MKKIAVFLNEDKKLDNFYNCNTIMVYGGGQSDCFILEEKQFEKITPSSAKEIIAMTNEITKMVDDCEAVAFGAISGIAYTVFDKANFSIFTIEENSIESIKSIYDDLFEFEKELAEKKEALLELKPRVTDEPGTYFFDLFSALNENPDLSSKKLLKEFFDTVPFIQLKLKAGHIPPWLERDERFDIVSDDGNPVKNIVITKKICY